MLGSISSRNMRSIPCLMVMVACGQVPQAPFIFSVTSMPLMELLQVAAIGLQHTAKLFKFGANFSSHDDVSR